MRSVKVLALCLLVVVCSLRAGTQPTGTKGATVLFEGARLIVGDGRVDWPIVTVKNGVQVRPVP